LLLRLSDFLSEWGALLPAAAAFSSFFFFQASSLAFFAEDFLGKPLELWFSFVPWVANFSALRRRFSSKCCSIASLRSLTAAFFFLPNRFFDFSAFNRFIDKLVEIGLRLCHYMYFLATFQRDEWRRYVKAESSKQKAQSLKLECYARSNERSAKPASCSRLFALSFVLYAQKKQPRKKFQG